MAHEQDYRERPACKTMSVPDAGRFYLGLGRNASDAAADRGDLPTIRVGGRRRVVIAAMEKRLEQVA